MSTRGRGVLHRIITDYRIDKFGTDAGEGSLCEYADRRLGEIFNFVMHGQLQLMIGENGENLVKQFDLARWESF